MLEKATAVAKFLSEIDKISPASIAKHLFLNVYGGLFLFIVAIILTFCICFIIKQLKAYKTELIVSFVVALIATSVILIYLYMVK